MVNKFEMIGIFISIGLMALALFLLRVDNNTLAELSVDSDSQPAIAIVAGENKQDEMYRTLAESIDTEGTLQNLIIDDVVVGSGDEVVAGDTVSVNYIGKLQNGQEFDNSYNRGEPFTFTVGQGRVIAGWEEGIQGMQVGGQRILVIPPQMAYGEQAVGPIPANSTLLFTVELVSIK